MSRNGPARALLDAVIAFYGDANRLGDESAATMLDDVRPLLASAMQLSLAPRAIGAAALLQDALPACALGASIAQAAHLFTWRQKPNYYAANMGPAFMAGYGYVEFVGPKDALFHAPDIRVGLLLLGPRLHYPPHAHPAEEIYHPLTEGALWRRGQENWRTVPAGHAIHHPSLLPHETKSGESTLLALYCWHGNTVTEAQLTI